jgi:cytochrome c2
MSKRLLLLALLAIAALILAGCGEPALTTGVDHGEAAAGEHTEGEAVAEGVATQETATETAAEGECGADAATEEAPAEATPTGDSHGHGAGDTTAASAEATPVPGDPAHGQALFNTLRTEVGFACATCHRVDSPDQLIGPGLLNVSVHGATHVEGLDAYEYIYQSITEPGAYVVTGFPDNLMPRTYAELFSAQDIQDIIAYLFTLKD